MIPLLALTFGILTIATIAGQVLRLTRPGSTIHNVNVRIAAWWVLCILTGGALLLGSGAVNIFFAAVSFLALREYITITPTNKGDHRTLLGSFFLFTPLQYFVIWKEWSTAFAILIPVYAFLYVGTRNALAGPTDGFLERTSKIHWGLMSCTYGLSHVPALQMLRIPGYESGNAALVFYFLLIAQLSDVLQYLWGKALGRRLIAPGISPNKTWEGFAGGVLTATGAGTALWWATPFQPWQAALMCLAITLTGFAGGLIFSAIKRDKGVKDYGTLVAGHGGVLDRVDSLCFSAPVFFYLTRYFFAG